MDVCKKLAHSPYASDPKYRLRTVAAAALNVL
jgi:hypothetical protein